MPAFGQLGMRAADISKMPGFLRYARYCFLALFISLYKAEAGRQSLKTAAYSLVGEIRTYKIYIFLL